MADRRNILVFDFETGSKFKDTTEIIQIGAVVIDQRSLKIRDSFESLMKPLDFDTLEDEALKVNGITRERLKDAPEAATVFPAWAAWIQKYNTRKDKGTFGAPIPCGWGIDNFDMPIITRYCKKYGYWDNKWDNQNLLNPVFTFDVMKFIWMFTRTNAEIDNIKLTTVLEYMGVPKQEIIDGAHSAIWDVTWTAKIAIKLLNLGVFLTDVSSETGKRRLEMANCFVKQERA